MGVEVSLGEDQDSGRPKRDGWNGRGLGTVRHVEGTPYGNHGPSTREGTVVFLTRGYPPENAREGDMG